MTIFALPSEPETRDSILTRIVTRFRVPSTFGEATMEFLPDLSLEDEALVQDIIELSVASAPWLASAYDAVRPLVQEIRAHRQLGRSAFMALSAAERDRMTYDVQVAQTRILLALLREAD